VNEEEWLSGTDPWNLLAFAQTLPDAERKLRLFACALCRRRWRWVKDERSRAAVEVAERFADGRASWKELAAAEEAARGAVDSSYKEPVSSLQRAAFLAAGVPAGHAALSAQQAAEGAVRHSPERLAILAERRQHLDLLRDLFGNPFRPPAIDPAWLAWGGGPVGGVHVRGAPLRRPPHPGRRTLRKRAVPTALLSAGPSPS
jgi:hypothetical protein